MQPTTTPGTIAICKESSDDEDCSGGDYIDAQKLTFTSKDFRIPSPNILIGDKVSKYNTTISLCYQTLFINLSKKN